jgi:hypothetical protein
LRLQKPRRYCYKSLRKYNLPFLMHSASYFKKKISKRFVSYYLV